MCFYTQLYWFVCALLTGHADHQTLDKVQHRSCVCLCAAVLHLHQDHPQRPLVSEITQRLHLYWYTPGCGHFNIPVLQELLDLIQMEENRYQKDR